jgi:hypothetical protein
MPGSPAALCGNVRGGTAYLNRYANKERYNPLEMSHLW